MTDTYLDIIKRIVLSKIDKKEVFVFLFGSRSSAFHLPTADVDIGLWSRKNLSHKIYHQIRNALDESIVPLKVDIIDFSNVDNSFKKTALKQIEIWNKPENLNIDSIH